MQTIVASSHSSYCKVGKALFGGHNMACTTPMAPGYRPTGACIIKLQPRHLAAVASCLYKPGQLLNQTDRLTGSLPRLEDSDS